MINASVSVIIPCFCCARTIGRAIQSVARQSIRPNEIIFVDDASGDSTLDVLRRIQSEYRSDWIKIFVMEHNSGPSAARNLGWNNAVSDYIAFLDADDAWHPHKIEIQYNWMNNNPKVVLTAHSSVVLKEGMKLPSLPKQWKSELIKPRSLLLRNQFSTPTVMLKRNLPFRFPETQRYSEDYLLWLQIVMHYDESYLLKLPLTFLFKARYGEGGLSAYLWAMEKGELTSYRQLYSDGLISKEFYCFLLPYSLAKYLYRCIRIKLLANKV